MHFCLRSLEALERCEFWYSSQIKNKKVRFCKSCYNVLPFPLYWSKVILFDLKELGEGWMAASKTELFLETLDIVEKYIQKELSHDWVSPLLSLEKCARNRIHIIQKEKNAPLSFPSI